MALQDGNRDTNWRSVVRCTPRSLYSWRKYSRLWSDWRVVGRGECLNRWWRETFLRL